MYILLHIFNHFNVLYFNCIIARLLSDWPLLCFPLLTASLRVAEICRFTTCS